MYDRHVAVRDPSQRFSYLFEPIDDETAGDVDDGGVVEHHVDDVADEDAAPTEVLVGDSDMAAAPSPRRWWPWFAAAAGALAAAIALSVWQKPAPPAQAPTVPPTQPDDVIN